MRGIQGVAIKKPDSCSNPLLKKIRQSKCYPLQCSSLHDPYTAPCEFSTVGRNQCCRSSCVMLFKSCVAFAFTASTDSNPVPLSADLIFGKRKKYSYLLCSKYLQWELIVQFHKEFRKYRKVTLPVYRNQSARI